jgi:hypothetical protein
LSAQALRDLIHVTGSQNTQHQALLNTLRDFPRVLVWTHSPMIYHLFPWGYDFSPLFDIRVCLYTGSTTCNYTINVSSIDARPHVPMKLLVRFHLCHAGIRWLSVYPGLPAVLERKLIRQTHKVVDRSLSNPTPLPPNPIRKCCQAGNDTVRHSNAPLGGKPDRLFAPVLERHGG